MEWAIAHDSDPTTGCRGRRGGAKRSHTWGEGIYTHSQTSHIFAFMLHCHSRETFHCANIKTEKKIKQCGQFYDSTWEERRQIVVTDISEVKEEICVKDERHWKAINWLIPLNRTKIKTALICWNSRLKWKSCFKILLRPLVQLLVHLCWLKHQYSVPHINLHGNAMAAISWN